MNILLIFPPFERLMRVKNDFFPLSLGYLAAVLRDAGHHARIYNADIGSETASFTSYWLHDRRTSGQNEYLQSLRDPSHYVWEEIRTVLRQQGPDMVGITVSGPMLPGARAVAQLVKEVSPGCVVVCGGPHVTVCQQEVMEDPNVDIAVRGEGEATIVSLAEVLEADRPVDGIAGISYKKNGRAIANPLRPHIQDLDSLPFPARDLLLFPEHYAVEKFGNMIGSRGCPFRCTFCDSHATWGRRPRFRSVGNVVSEIQHVNRDFGCRKFHFVDDTFTFSRSRLVSFCKAIRASGLEVEWSCYSRADVLDLRTVRTLRSAGCSGVSLGLESGSERMLRIMKKKIKIDDVRRACKLLRRHGIQVITTALIGTPDETEDDIRQTIRLLRELKPDIVTANTYVPYPGSDMYEQAKGLGLVGDRPDWEELSHSSSLSGFAVHIPPGRFQALREQLFRTAYECNTRLSLFNVRRWICKNFRLLRDNPRELLRRVFRTVRLRLRILYTRAFGGAQEST